MSRRALEVAVLAVAAALPLLSLWGHPGHFLADLDSELPVKLWAHQVFWEDVGLFGGVVEALGWPSPGPLNNAELAATLWFALWRPLLGEPFAWNSLVFVTLWANMLALWALARPRVRQPWAAVVAAVAWGLTPLALAYGVMSAITDVLQLWPYPLALHFGLRGLTAEGRRWDGLAAGGMLGLGALTCLYNVLVFAPLVVPVGLWLALRWRTLDRRRLAWTIGGAALGLAAVAGPFLAWTAALMSGTSSQMSDEMVQATRHAWPFDDLRPHRDDRYTAFLRDWLAVGKGALVTRDLGSRFYRAFSPGVLVLVLGAVGLWRRPAARLWAAIGAFFVLASVGPFLPWTAAVSANAPVNPVYLLCFYGVPGGTLLLEPFRYGLPAVLGLCLAAAHGADVVAERAGPAVAALAALVVAEVALLSPLPLPLPVARPVVPGWMADLDDQLPAGAVIELPWFEQGTGRFSRERMLHQRVHGRPVGAGIGGLPPPYFLDNALLASLLAAEGPPDVFELRPGDARRHAAAAQALVDDGFVALLLHPGIYRSTAEAEAAMALLDAHFPREQREGAWVYRLTASALAPRSP